MPSPSFKSLPNSSFSFSKQHTQSPSFPLPLPKQSFLLSILKINLFLPSLSFISLDSRMWLNEWHSLIPHPSHITLHHSSLSWWVNHLKCFDVVSELSWEVVMMCLMRGVNEREREVIVMKDDVDEMNNTSVVVVFGKHDWCHDVVWMRGRWKDKGVWGWWCVVEWDECPNHHVCVFITSDQKKTIVKSRIKYILAYLIKWRSWMWVLN